MPEKISPFVEGKYGWDFGESGWNWGMDENLLKFAYLFDKTVNGVVSSLPPLVEGNAYYLTTDRRIYFAVNSIYHSTPIPKWFIFHDRSTGEAFQFDGTDVAQIPTTTDLSTQIQSLSEDVSSLNTSITFNYTSTLSEQVVPLNTKVFRTLSYRTEGDKGGAIFYGPFETDPVRADAVEVGYGDELTRRWYVMQHTDSVNVDQLGAYGTSYDIFDGGSWVDDSVYFSSAIELAGSLGLNKISSSGGKGYGVKNVLIENDIEIDLKGSTIYGDFGPWGTSTVDSTPIYWTRNIFYTEATNPRSITIRNFEINGQNSPTVQMAGGEILLDFRGGASAGDVSVTLVDGVITRGANRLYSAGSGVSVPTAVLDYRNTDVLLYNIDNVVLNNLEVRSSPAEMITIQSDDARTVWSVINCRFTKRRDGETNRWSNSALNVFNCSSGSSIRDSFFYEFVKGPMNIETDGVVVENVRIKDVNDSNGIDFCESRAIRQNQFIVRNCYISEVANVGIRGSASNILCENNTFQNVDICHSFEGGVVGNPSRGAWVRTDPAPLYNVVVRNPVYKTFNVSHTNLMGVRVLGASATQPVNITVDGNGNFDRPINRPLYGIHATHANLQLRGYHGEGRTAVVYLEGTCKLAADGVTFAPETGQSVHTILAINAVLGVDAINIRRSQRITSLDVDHSDFRITASTVDLRAINVEQSPNFPGVTTTEVVQFDGELKGTSGAFNVPAVASGSSTTLNVTVAGARIGDSARAIFSIDTGGLVVLARVSASNTVTVIFFNPTGSSIDIGGGIATAYVRQAR